MGMRMSNIEMSTTVSKEKLLAILRANRETHGTIVREAREGYVKQARKALEERLSQLERGEVASLAFQLSPPADYTSIYNTSIKMLEWNTLEVIELAADEFRQLVLDEWDWMRGFLESNSTYSATAARSCKA